MNSNLKLIFLIFLIFILRLLISNEISNSIWVRYKEHTFPDGKKSDEYIVIELKDGKFDEYMLSAFPHPIGSGTYKILPKNLHPTIVTLKYVETKWGEEELFNTEQRYYIENDSLFNFDNEGMFFRDTTFVDSKHTEFLVHHRWFVPNEKYSDYIIFPSDSTYIFYDSVIDSIFVGNMEVSLTLCAKMTLDTFLH